LINLDLQILPGGERDTIAVGFTSSKLAFNGYAGDKLSNISLK
jgi:hypothetical protein